MRHNRILLPNLSKRMHVPAQIQKTLKARCHEQKTQCANLYRCIDTLCIDYADIGLRDNHYPSKKRS